MLSAIMPIEITHLATTLTAGYAPLGVGMVGLMWLSAGMITWMAVQHYWEDAHLEIPAHPTPVRHPAKTTYVEPMEHVEYREAA